MPILHDCSVPSALLEGMRLARRAIASERLVVLPTDTVYGVAADAFSARAVAALLAAKGRGRQSPPPVLIHGPSQLDALSAFVPPPLRTLVDEFWPGGLTVITRARESLHWDLGDTGGTVALRMPDNPIALELIQETGPLAVSSANLTGLPAAMTAAEAASMLGDSVAVYLEAGEAGQKYGLPPAKAASTILDTSQFETLGTFQIVREGVVSREALLEHLDAGILAAPA
ncbi:L-threonylcarbamoyladenylate synthase [Humidisolicoccus flavus]|uniref:L-threonylcarbamoyladenylate synthase n=1 Tax=Humidisolicoccus flavus TaxID=3111414 RepID=UPI003244665C